MLYLKKIVQFSTPNNKSGDFVSRRETMEGIAGEYTLDMYETGSIAAIIVDLPKAIQSHPRMRVINRTDEAYIVNESGVTLRVINGPTRQTKMAESESSIVLSSNGEITVAGSMTTITYAIKEDAKDLNKIVGSIRDNYFASSPK